MRFFVMHLNDEPHEGEEVYLVVPGGQRTAIAVPLDALPAFLPLLARAAERLEPVRCPECFEPLPAGLAV